MKLRPQDMKKKDLHELFVSTMLPRPIAFVSTVSEEGIFNLAPFSFFTPLCLKPPIIAFSIFWKRDGQKKDTLRNIDYSKDFVVTVVTEAIAEAMNQTSADYPGNVSEFKEVGLTPIKGDLVKAPLVAESPVNMECNFLQIIEFGEAPTGSNFVLGEVILVHIRENVWAGDHADISRLKVIGRLGEDLYCRTTDVFEMKRPT
jgi:flavin reductase (DIM6/NTAB) family NADH-FMN oxidoreductase RutF